jgi:hypothetical protein
MSRVNDVKTEENPPAHKSLARDVTSNVAPVQNQQYNMSLPKASNIDQAPPMTNQNPYGYNMGYNHENTAPSPNNYPQNPNQHPGQNPYGAYQQQ